MTQPVAKRYPTPSLDKLPDDIRTRILAVQEKSGFVPNVFLTLTYRPDEFRAFFAYHDALMDKDGGLTKAEREMRTARSCASAPRTRRSPTRSPSTTARRILRRGSARCSISP